MVDGVLLLVDASEGPLPQTRFVLRKALEARLPVDPRRQQGRPARRAHRGGRERGLRALPRPRRGREPDRVPDRLRERARRAAPGSRPTSSRTTCGRSSRCCSSGSRRREYEEGHPLQALVTNLDASPYVGRLALCRVRDGTIRKGQQVAWCRADGRIERAKVTELYVTEALDRVDAEEAGPGEIVAVAGIPEVTIGETLADPDDPRPLPVIDVDEPSLSMTIGINTSPLAGQDGDALTATHGQGAARPGARRQRLAPRAPDRAAGRVGGAGPRRAAARGARRADAPRGLRAHRRQAAGRHARGRRQGARAGRAARDRRARGLRRRDHAAARAAQGPPGADGQPRHRLGADGVPRAGARPDRLPHRVPDRDARHRHPPPRLRRLRAVARRAAHAADRQPRRRPARPGDGVRAAQPAGARPALRRARASRSTRG